MRPLVLLAAALAAGSGCDSDTRPAAPAATGGSRRSAHPPTLALPAVVVYTTTTGQVRQVIAVSEDGSAPPVTLSTAGVDTSFVAPLSGRRALLAEWQDDRLVRLFAAAHDGSGALALGTAPTGYWGVRDAIEVDGVVAVELVRAEREERTDVFALRAGATPVALARAAALVAVADGRAAVLDSAASSSAPGRLRSVKLDGTLPLELGGGDGEDLVAEVRNGTLLITLHSAGFGDVKTVRLDGSAAHLYGLLITDEKAFGFAGERVVFARGGAVLSAAPGGDERLHGAGAPVAIGPAGHLLVGTATGALVAYGPDGAATTVDATGGPNARVAKWLPGRVIYTCDGAVARSLRVAPLDGRGATTLCEKERWLPYFAALASGRVAFHRSLSGDLEGGAMYSVKLDGSDLAPLGSAVVRLDGPAHPALSDQDFEAVTPSGRLILEAESEGVLGAQLLTAAADSISARELTAFGNLRFAGLIP